MHTLLEKQVKCRSLTPNVPITAESNHLPKDHFLHRDVPGLEGSWLVCCVPNCVVSAAESPGKCLAAAETAASAPQPRCASWHQSALCRKTWPTNDHLISFSIQFGSATWHLPSPTLPQTHVQPVPAQRWALGSAHAAAVLAGWLLPGNHREPLKTERSWSVLMGARVPDCHGPLTISWEPRRLCSPEAEQCTGDTDRRCCCAHFRREEKQLKAM